MKDDESQSEDGREVNPQYNVLSDNLRRCTPNSLQCSVFCGGRRCKYETPENWDSTHVAIRGIYSHWITDEILAMARPCTEIINKRNVITQFHSLGIRSLINLQEAREHSNCGCPLEPSGFTYDPTVFMENGIYHFNYAWPDYGDVKVTWLLDMVKIVCHALSEGKLAVHCHAGLGRTGVLIACYLVYSMRFRANDAIRFVRLKRPNSIQSRSQILCVQAFERYIRPYNVVFRSKLLLKQPKVPEITLPHYILTQKIMLHGYEARCIQHIPKIIYVVCERLLQLCGCEPVATIPLHKPAPTTLQFLTARRNPSHFHYINSQITFTAQNPPLGGEQDIDLQTQNESEDDYSEESELQPTRERTLLDFQEFYIKFTGHDVVEAFTVDLEDMSDSQRRAVYQYEMTLNHGEASWRSLQSEYRLVVLASLLTDWLEQLKTPIIDCELLCQIVINPEHPLDCLTKFNFVTQYTLEYLFRFVAHLRPISSEDLTCLVQRLIAALTQQSVEVKGVLLPKEKEFGKLRRGTYRNLMAFAMNFLNRIKKHISQDSPTSPSNEEDISTKKENKFVLKAIKKLSPIEETNSSPEVDVIQPAEVNNDNNKVQHSKSVENIDSKNILEN